METHLRGIDRLLRQVKSDKTLGELVSKNSYTIQMPWLMEEQALITGPQLKELSYHKTSMPLVMTLRCKVVWPMPHSKQITFRWPPSTGKILISHPSTITWTVTVLRGNSSPWIRTPGDGDSSSHRYSRCRIIQQLMYQILETRLVWLSMMEQAQWRPLVGGEKPLVTLSWTLSERRSKNCYSVQALVPTTKAWTM